MLPHAEATKITISLYHLCQVEKPLNTRLVALVCSLSHMRRTGLVLSLVVTASVSSVAAQPRQAGNAVTGLVVDTTGAVLPNAQVELKSAAGTTVQSTATDTRGAFRVDGVLPGRYDVLVTFEGFQPTTLHLTVGPRAPAPLRVTMPLAGITQEVTVGSAPAEVTTNASSNLDASSVDASAIENLP